MPLPQNIPSVPALLRGGPLRGPRGNTRSLWSVSKMQGVECFIRTRATGADSLRRRGDELLVAREIAVAVGQARGPNAARVDFA
jgi:hypothetical protein